MRRASQVCFVNPFFLLVAAWLIAGAQFEVSSARAQPAPVYAVPVQSAPVYVVPAGPPVQPVQVLEARPVQPVRAVHSERGSVLRYSLQGFFGGAVAGLAVGYLATDGAHADEAWRGLLLGTGIGALSGAGLGIGLGLIDASSERRPLRFVMRDAGYGTLLGGALGATVGGLVALRSHQGEDALFGAAVGASSGFVLGALVGLLEGHVRGRASYVVGGLNVSRDAAGRSAYGPSVSGRF